MPISFIGSIAGITSATIPTHAAGDLLLAFAYRDGSNTAPTIPAGWTTIGTGGGANTNSSVMAWRIATAPGTASGTWTNATSLVIHVYRGTLAAAIGGNGNTGAQSTSVSYPVLTMSNTDGSSWVVGFAGHRSVDTNLQTAPTGMTNRTTNVDATDEIAGHDTNGGVASWSATAVSVGGTSSGWRARTVEILEKRALTLAVALLTATATTPNVGFTFARSVAVTTATATATFTDSAIKKGYRLAADTATFNSSFANVELTRGSNLNNYSIPVTVLNGTAVTYSAGIVVTRKLPVSAATANATLYSLSIRAAKRITATTATGTSFFAEAFFSKGRLLAAAPMVSTGTMQDAGLRTTRLIAATPATASFTANPVALLKKYHLPVATLAADFTGYDVAFKFGKQLIVQPISSTAVLYNASVIVNRYISAATLSSTATGNNVVITVIQPADPQQYEHVTLQSLVQVDVLKKSLVQLTDTVLSTTEQEFHKRSVVTSIHHIASHTQVEFTLKSKTI